MIILLHGTNRLAIDERLQQLRAEHDPTELSTTFIEGAAGALSDLRSAIGSPAFFGGTRLVVALHLITGGSAGRGRRAVKRSSRSEDELAGLLRNVPTSTLLILLEDNLGPNEERAVRNASHDAQIERYDVPRGRSLVDWACDRARQYDAVLPPATAAQLLEALFPAVWQRASRRDDVPPDLHRLDAEIAKLATAAGAGGSIGTDHVATLIAGAEAQNIWGLGNAIAEGDPAAAIREAERALTTGSAPEMLIGQLTSQFEALAALTCGTADLRDVALRTGLTESRLRQTVRTARNFPARRVREALEELRALDLKAKQGRQDVADGLISTIANLARRG